MADRDILIQAFRLAQNDAQREALEQQWRDLNNPTSRANSPWENFTRGILSGQARPGGGNSLAEIAGAPAPGKHNIPSPRDVLSFFNTSAEEREAREAAARQLLAGTTLPAVAERRAGRQPQAQQASAPTGLTLAAPAATQPTAKQPANTAEFLTSMFPGVRVTGGDRTPERNAEVGGASRSHHLTPGRAVDMAPIPGKTIEDVANAYRAAGWTVHEALDETKKTNGTGPHWHIAASPPGGGGGSSRARGPNLQAPSPNDLMSFIPNPESIPTINLPDAPQQAMPAARPTMELADKGTLLAELTAAMQVKPRDQSQDSWDRVQAMLQGAAQGAAQGDGINIGQMLLLAGGGALGGFRGERAEQRAMNKEEEEAQRQVKIALAKMGFEIDTANLDTRNQNANINWQSGEDIRTTSFANANANFENSVRELLTNSGITAQNVGNRNQANMARGQIGAGALQDQFSVGNQVEQLGWQTEQARELAGAGGRGSVLPGTRLLLGVGISPDRQAGESPEVTNARSAAGLIEMGNVNAGLNSLANELVVTGRYALPDLLDSETAKQVEQLIQQEKVAAAQNLILQKLQAAPGQQQAVVDMLANQGSLIATMIKARQGTQG